MQTAKQQVSHANGCGGNFPWTAGYIASHSRIQLSVNSHTSDIPFCKLKISDIIPLHTPCTHLHSLVVLCWH